VHRVRQFVAHVRARVDPAEEAAATHLLGPAALELFRQMPVADRRHALDVVTRLRSRGEDDADLLAAALLHDAGKGHRMRLWHRVAGVLLDAVAPRLLARLANPDPTSWGHPLHLYRHHAAISAQLAADAGCSARTAAFIRGGVAEEDVQRHRALTEADDAS
jgi:hypothetical protein